MNYLTVDLYSDFKCIAEACPNTCCSGWDIIIDNATHQKMIEHEKELGVPAKDWLEEKNGKIYAKLKGQRCCMLNEQNLCHVVCTLGEEYLSETCQLYPRAIRPYGNVVEVHLSISCPEIIHALMNKDNVMFDFAEDETPVSPYIYNQLYLFESAVRTGIIDILQQFSDISLHARLFACYKIIENAIELYQKETLDSQAINQYIDSYFVPGTMACLDKQLHDIVNESNQLRIMQSLHTILRGTHPFHERFTELIAQTGVYFSEITTEKFALDLAAFRKHIAKYNKFYTNFWSYRAFSELIQIPDYEHVAQNFIYIAAELCLTQTMALAVFANNQQLNDDEYVFIISCISRCMEHNQGFRNQLTQQLLENDAINLAGLLLLTLI